MSAGETPENMPEYLRVSKGASNTLYELWKASGLTQDAVANICGMTQGSLSNILHGRHANWQIATMVRVANVLGHRVEVRFIPKDCPTQKPPVGHTGRVAWISPEADLGIAPE